MAPYALLFALFLFNILSSMAFKRASHSLPHDIGPVYTCGWILIGLILWFCFSNTLFFEGINDVREAPILAGLLLLKGVFIWVLFSKGMELTQYSLSARSYLLPSSIGFIAIINNFLGESLTLQQWVAVIGLFILGVSFFFRGHIQALSKQGRLLFLFLIFTTICCATLDQLILSDTNWFVLLLFTNLVALSVSFSKKISGEYLKAAFVSAKAVMAGVAFMVTEMLKFYLMVSIFPMSVVISVQVATIPIILVLSAVIWGERGWKEQLIWGILSAGLLLLLFI